MRNGAMVDFTLLPVYNNGHAAVGERLKREIYAMGYNKMGHAFLAFVATNLAPKLLR